MPYHVQRHGRCIVVHDECTPQVTDTCSGPEIREPAPLASRSWWHTWTARLLAAGLTLTGLSLAVLRTTRPAAPPRLKAIVGSRAEVAEQIRRGTPVIHATTVLSSPPVRPAFPLDKVSARAIPCRAAVLALDASDAPLHCSAGFVIGDGTQVVTTLTAVSGASAVELRLANGRCTRATTVTLNEEAGLAVLGTELVTEPLDWSSASPVPEEQVFIAGHSLMPPPPLAMVLTSFPEESRCTIASAPACQPRLQAPPCWTLAAKSKASS